MPHIDIPVTLRIPMSARDLRDHDNAQSLARDILEWAECNDISKAALIREHPALGSDKTLASIAAGRLAELDTGKWLDAYRSVAAALVPDAEDDPDPLFEDLSTAKRVRSEFTRLKMSRTNAKLLIVEGATGMGKTSAGVIISRKMRELNPVAHIHHIEASAGWGDRPNAVFAAILKTLGMPEGPGITWQQPDLPASPTVDRRQYGPAWRTP
jgi:hypothetical protein